MSEKTSRRTKDGPRINNTVRRILEYLLEGKTFREIAPIMNSKIDAIKIRVYRAKRLNNLQNNIQLAAMVAIENHILRSQEK